MEGPAVGVAVGVTSEAEGTLWETSLGGVACTDVVLAVAGVAVAGVAVTGAAEAALV